MFTLNKGKLSIAASIAVLLTACGGGTSTNQQVTMSSILNDAPTKGVCYSAVPSGISGATGSDGSFNYIAGDNVKFWIQVDGSVCPKIVPLVADATAILLGDLTPLNNTTNSIDQTFILQLSSGARSAEVIQALNHGTSSIMDVSGLSLPTGFTKIANDYVSSAGAKMPENTTVVDLFKDLQSKSTVNNLPLIPVLPVTETFQADVANNFSTTATSGILLAPSSFSIDAPRLVLRVLNGVDSPSNVSYSSQYMLYYDGSGIGARFKTGLSVPTTLDNTYEITGAKIETSYANKNEHTTITYFDEKISFFTGMNDYFSDVSKSSVYSTGSYGGYQINLTPVVDNNTATTIGGVLGDFTLDTATLSKSLVAGKVLTLEFPMCAGVSTLTFSTDGLSAQSSCAGGLWVAGFKNLPGVLFLTQQLLGNNTLTGGPKELYFALEGPTVQAGASLVYLTNNAGITGDYNGTDQAIKYSWGKMLITKVQ